MKRLKDLIVDQKNNETFNLVESDVEEISKMISAMASLRSISPTSRL